MTVDSVLNYARHKNKKKNQFGFLLDLNAIRRLCCDANTETLNFSIYFIRRILFFNRCVCSVSPQSI